MIWYLREHRETTGTFSGWRKTRVFVLFVCLVGWFCFEFTFRYIQIRQCNTNLLKMYPKEFNGQLSTYVRKYLTLKINV